MKQVKEIMDVAWGDVRIEMSPSDPEVYGNPGFFGLIYTASSTAVFGYYQQLRHFGAQTRHVLLQNAAYKWHVPVTELVTEPSVVVHEGSGRKLTYGEIARFGKLPEREPEIKVVDLKDPADFRLIGHSVPRHDVLQKVLGDSNYSINQRLPGMIYATALRAPVMGAAPVNLNDAAAHKTAGVSAVHAREHSVVIAADSTAAALKARRRYIRLRPLQKPQAWMRAGLNCTGPCWAVVYGLGNALTERITFRNGRVQQANVITHHGELGMKYYRRA